MFYQQMVHQSHSDYLRFFIDKGINVFIWNYRSYGRSNGSLSPNHLLQDIHAVHKFLLTKIKVTGKVGIYGRSLGGISTCHLSPLVDMVIVDRSFSNLRDMSIARFGGSMADFLFKVGSFGWQSQNDFDFLRPFKGNSPNQSARQRIIRSASNSFDDIDAPNQELP